MIRTKICPGVKKWGNTCWGGVPFLVAPEQTDSITLPCLEQFETDERIVLLVSLIALKAALKFVWNGIFSSCDGTSISTSKAPFVVCAHLRSCVLIESSELAGRAATMSEQMSSFVSAANNTVKSFSSSAAECSTVFANSCLAAEISQNFLHERELKWQKSAEMSWKGRIQLWVYHYSKIWKLQIHTAALNTLRFDKDRWRGKAHPHSSCTATECFDVVPFRGRLCVFGQIMQRAVEKPREQTVCKQLAQVLNIS